MLKLNRQGALLVARDENDKVVHDKNGNAVVRKVPKDAPKQTWRAFLREMTHNGEDLLVAAHNIAQGVPFTVTHKGQEMEPQVPSAEVRLRAIEFLILQLHGRPVAQNEVLQSEVAAEEMARFAALSEAQLREMAAPLLNAGKEEDADIT